MLQQQVPYQYPSASIDRGSASPRSASESDACDAPSPIRQAQSRAAARIRYVRQSGARSQVEVRARAASRAGASGRRKPRSRPQPQPRPRQRSAQRRIAATHVGVDGARRGAIRAVRAGRVEQQEQGSTQRSAKRAGAGALPSPARIAQAHTAEAMVRLMQLHTHATLALADEEAKSALERD